MLSSRRQRGLVVMTTRGRRPSGALNATGPTEEAGRVANPFAPGNWLESAGHTCFLFGRPTGTLALLSAEEEAIQPTRNHRWISHPL